MSGAGSPGAASSWSFTHSYSSNWHPVTWLSHMLDVQCFGLNAGGHHLTSLLFHVANTVLLFLVLKRMTGARGRSALVAALFALHPLHVESVAWVAERKDVLSAFFFMLTLWAYARYTEGRRLQAGDWRPEEAGRMQNAECGDWTTHHAPRTTAPSSIFYLLSLCFFALGLMSKPMLVTLPFVLLLLDFWPLRRLHLSIAPPLHHSITPSLGLVWEKLPFLALSAAASVATVLAQWSGGSVETLDRVPITARLINALIAGLGYLEKMVWPTGLAILYLRPAQWPLWRIGLAISVLAGISVMVWALRRGRGWLTVGWLWFLGMLVPVSGLVQVGSQAFCQCRLDRAYTRLGRDHRFICLVQGVGKTGKAFGQSVLVAFGGKDVIILAELLQLRPLRVHLLLQLGKLPLDIGFLGRRLGSRRSLVRRHVGIDPCLEHNRKPLPVGTPGNQTDKIGIFHRHRIDHFLEFRGCQACGSCPSLIFSQGIEYGLPQLITEQHLPLEFHMLRVGDITGPVIDNRGRYQQGGAALVDSRPQEGPGQTDQQAAGQHQQKNPQPAPVAQGIGSLNIRVLWAGINLAVEVSVR